MGDVTVHNHTGHRVALHLNEMHEFEHGSYSINPTGVKTASRGQPVVLNPGANAVDAAFWRLWSEQHEGTPLAAHFSTEEQPPDERPDPEQPARD